MKLIKLKEEHYVVENNDGVITYSTDINFNEVYYIPLSEVKELLGEVDVEKKAKEWLSSKGFKETSIAYTPFVSGYNQAIEDNKEKKYTEAQLIWAIQEAYGHGQNDEFDGVNKAEKSIIVITNYLHPKTEWEVDIINGKLTLI